MTHEEARDAMPLFVVDADDRQTRDALLAHLAGCEACREEFQEFGLAADALAQAVPQVRPRPELRTRTLAAILGADHPQSAAPSTFPPPQTPARERPVAIVAPARAAWAPWLAAAAALLAAVAIGGLWQTRGQLEEMRTTLALWQARVTEAERNAQTAQTTLVAYRRQLDVMSADDVLFVSLAGVPPAAGAQAKAFVSASENTIIFSARDLPALPAAQVYQLWAIANGQPISAGTFVPDARGRFQLVAEVPTLTTRPAALAVTVEPQGGVPAPTGPKYLLGAPAE